MSARKSSWKWIADKLESTIALIENRFVCHGDKPLNKFHYDRAGHISLQEKVVKPPM